MTYPEHCRPPLIQNPDVPVLHGQELASGDPLAIVDWFISQTRRR